MNVQTLDKISYINKSPLRLWGKELRITGKQIWFVSPRNVRLIENHGSAGINPLLRNISTILERMRENVLSRNVVGAFGQTIVCKLVRNV